jgi:Tol biopolymer transport system component
MLAGSSLEADGQNTLFFGLQPPGDKPEIFAPGVVSSNDQVEMGCTISPDGKEFYFARAVPSGPDVGIWVVREENGKLSTPKVVSFSGIYRDFNPFITPDGKRMIFYRMSFEEAETRQGSWVVERSGNTWGEPRFLLDQYCVTTPDFRTFYFGSRREVANRNLVMRTLENGVFSEPQDLRGGINSEAWDAHGVISSDGSFMLYDSQQPGGFDKTDMYVSFRNDDGSWSDGHNLGEKINKGHRHMPCLSHDGKYIFFASEEDIWWVRADVIDQLKERQAK